MVSSNVFGSMESETREKEPTASQWRHIGGEAIDIAYRGTDGGITESLQRQLQAMHSTFLTASDSILAHISETGLQLEQLEKRIDEMVKEAGRFRVNPSAPIKRSPRHRRATRMTDSFVKRKHAKVAGNDEGSKGRIPLAPEKTIKK